MASTSTTGSEAVVPQMEPPKTFFTADPADYPEINAWFEGNKLDYSVFYASFLNYTILTARKYADPKTKKSLSQEDQALLWIFDDVPVNTQGLLDAMSAYGEDHFDGGVTSGVIDLEKGRKATTLDIQHAEKKLAELLYNAGKRQELLKEHKEFTHLFQSGKASRKGKKSLTRSEKKVMKGMGGMELEEEEDGEGED